jgi:protein Mpv17
MSARSLTIRILCGYSLLWCHSSEEVGALSVHDVRPMVSRPTSDLARCSEMRTGMLLPFLVSSQAQLKRGKPTVLFVETLETRNAPASGLNVAVPQVPEKDGTMSDLMEQTSLSSWLASHPTSPFTLPPELMTWQSVYNALLLTATFGYAIYTILNIDHGMTRGWTQSEIAMRIPLDTWSSYETSLASKPIYTKTLINVIIYLLGDWLSQTIFQKKHVLDFDATRVMKNGLIGLFFGPLVHEYYQFSDTILPPDGGLQIRLQKILMDQTIYLTVKCSMYISAVGILNGENFDTIATNVKTRIGTIVFTAWRFWPLVHCITYGVIPARHRILWVNSVDLIWNAILATLARKTSDDAKTDTQIDEATDPDIKMLMASSERVNTLEYLNEESLDSGAATSDQFAALPFSGISSMVQNVGVGFDSYHEKESDTVNTTVASSLSSPA